MSGPAVPEPAFYSPQSDNLLFPGTADVEIRVRAGLRCVGLKHQVCRNEFAPFLTREAEALPGNDAYNLASAAIPGDYDPQGHKTESVEAAKVSFAGAEGTRVYG